MDNKFTKFWKNYGPMFLFISALTQFLFTKNIPVGMLFMVLGIILMLDND